jgi:hypothetical protein
MQTVVSWTPDGESYMLHAEYFEKNLALSEKSTFLPVLVWFCMRALWRGFGWKMPIFCPRSQFLPDSSNATAISQKAQGGGLILCAYWTAGFTVRPPDIGSASGYKIFQVPNRTIGCILKRSARLYGDCMEPNHMAKYSLPVLTDLTGNLIRKTHFLCANPLTVMRVFLDASRHSAFTYAVFTLSSKLQY